jgi:hypothetical protein
MIFRFPKLIIPGCAIRRQGIVRSNKKKTIKYFIIFTFPYIISLLLIIVYNIRLYAKRYELIFVPHVKLFFSGTDFPRNPVQFLSYDWDIIEDDIEGGRGI